MAVKVEVADEDRELGKVGLRGLVLHDGDPETGRFAYYPDNELESWRQLRTGLAGFAEARGLDLKQLSVLEETGVAVAVLRGNGRTFFLNLDGFHGLGWEETIRAADRSTSVPDGEDAVLIRENGDYYVVAKSELRELNRKDAGEAKIVVRRGAVTAAIPNNGLPLGTNCVLINLTQLVPGGTATTAAAARHAAVQKSY